MNSVGNHAFEYLEPTMGQVLTLPQSITFYIPSSVNEGEYKAKIAQGTVEGSWPGNWSTTTIQE